VSAICDGLSDSSVKISHIRPTPKTAGLAATKARLDVGEKIMRSARGPRLVTRHIETCSRPQIHDLIELRVEVGIGLGLILAFVDLLLRHKIRPSADYQTVLAVNDIAERHTISRPGV